jgi:HAD superfamily hydrolase (TIGR01459 family)
LQQRQSPSCQILPGLAAVQYLYDAYLIDAWGVLHDGKTLYPGALECLTQLRRLGKKVIILSNAARRRDAVASELNQIGIDHSLYQDIVSSGELAWCSMRERIDKGSFFGKQGYYLGPVRSRGLLEGLELSWQDSIQHADFILNTGAPEGNPPDTAGCEGLLKTAVKLKLPMICANPDTVAIRGGQAGISAGAIAERYRQLGATVIEYHGKPHYPIYDSALSLLGDTSRNKILALGDAFATDILGARNAGIDSWLIAGGIHRRMLDPLSLESVSAAVGSEPIPDNASEYFAW